MTYRDALLRYAALSSAVRSVGGDAPDRVRWELLRHMHIAERWCDLLYSDEAWHEVMAQDRL